MNANIKAAAPNTTGSTQSYRAMADRGATESREALDKMSAATTEAADVIKHSYSSAVKGAQDYNNKFIEYVYANTNAAFEFLHKLSSVKSPSEFVELSTEHARKQLETLTEQTKQLGALAQKGTQAATEPLKTGVSKAFNHAA